MGGHPRVLHKPFMACMGNVPSLVGHNPLPSLLLKPLPVLPGCKKISGKWLAHLGEINQRYLAAQELILICKGPLHPGVLLIPGAINILSHLRFVV